MKRPKVIYILVSALIVFTGFSISAQATLIDRGNGLIYDSDLNITWLQNANLASQETFGVGGVLQGGQMNWYTALSWISAMNSANYLGYSNWRLPQTLPVNGSSYNYLYSYNGSTDYAYNVGAANSAYPDSSGSELAHLYYVDLGNKGIYDTGGNLQAGSGVINGNAGPFINLASLPAPYAASQLVIFWSETAYAPDPVNTAWSFRFDDGLQAGYGSQFHGFYVWPVLPGDPAYPGSLPQPPPSPGNVVFAVNAGGGGYSGQSGIIYQADEDYSGGLTASTSTAVTAPPSYSAPAADNVVYQSQRYGNFAYNIPLSNGNYTVTLKFAETYWDATGKRLFNVSVQGAQLITNLDIFAMVGFNAPYDVTVPVTVTNGTLNINFTSIKDNACVSAIVVTSGSSLPPGTSPDTTPPSVPAGISATVVSSSQINLSWAASTDPAVYRQVSSGLAGYKIYRNGSPIGTTATTNYQDMGLSASTTYSYTVSAYDAAGNASAQSGSVLATTNSAAVIPSISNTVFAVNSGGGQYTNTAGVVYKADTVYAGGSAASTTATITGTTDPVLYQSERYGNFSYNVPLANGNYTVTLKFAEIYWNAAGQRVFNVGMQGQQVIAGLDIFSKVGKNAAYDVSLPVSVTSGTLNISFTSVVDQAKVSAIIVTAASAGTSPDTTPPSMPAGLSTTVVSSSQINLSWAASTDPVVSGQVTSGMAGYKIYRNGSPIGTTATTNYQDMGLSASTTYSYAVSAYDAAGNASAQSGPVSATTNSVAATPSASNAVFAANSGGGQYTAASGVVYQADTDYSGGSTASTAVAVTGTTDPTLYQSERYGNFSYIVPLANGNYTVTLKFAEIYWNAAGKRIFNVSMQGRQVITNLDIFALAGINAAYDISLPVSVTNGTLNISFTSVVDNAKVSAIVVTLPSGTSLSPDTTPPSGPWGLSTTVVSSSQINLSWAASTDPVVYGQVTSGMAGYKIYRNGSPIGTTATTNYQDTGLTASTTYSYTVSAYDAAGNPSAQSGPVSATTNSVAATPPAGNAVFAANSGGGQYTDTAGVVYQADTDYSGGSTASTAAAITGTTDPTLYQSERYGNFSYNVPLANGNYMVTLKFAEIYWNSAGQRVFDVSMQGTQVISNLDIFAQVGKDAAYDVSIPVSVTNGTLNISFTSIVDNAKVSAIKIILVSSQPSKAFFDNAGGGQYTDTAGNLYQADTDYAGGSVAATTATITGTTDPTLYQSERYGNFSYNVPLANGNYMVTLKFAEIYWNAAGQRVFNVSMQGTQVINNLDIFAQVGKNAAYNVSIPVSVTNGTLNINFTSVVDNAKVSAIEITPN